MLLARKISVVFAFFLITASFSHGQKNVSDSLKTILSHTQNDTVYVETLNKLSKIYRWQNPIMALDYAVKAEKIAKNCNYHNGLALAYHNIGALYANKGNNKLALEYYKKCFKLYQLYNNKLGLANVQGNMGLIYRRQKNYTKALELHNKSLIIKKQLNDTIGIAYSYGNIGLVFSEQGKYDKALIHFYNSLRLKETLNDKYGMANSYGNIGVIYFEIESYDQAQVNLERSLMLFKKIGNKTGIAESLLYLGEIYRIQNLNSKAIDALNQSLEINKEKENIEGIADAYLKIGKIKASVGNYYQAYSNYINSLNYYNKIPNPQGIVNSKLLLAKYYLHFNDFDNAKVHLKKALIIAQKQSFLKQEYEISKLLAGIYLKQENYYRASKILFNATILLDSLSIKSMAKEVTQIQMQYDFDKKMQQKEIEAMRIEANNRLHIQKTKMVRNIIAAFFVIALIVSILIYKSSINIKKQNETLEKQKNLINKQLVELQEQKNSLEKANHTKDKFLSIIGHDLRNPFNAINSFVALVTEQPHKLNDDMLMKYLFLIKDAGANAMNLLDNLLEWAKTQSGEIVAQKEEVLLNYILRGNVLLIKEMARQKNIEIIEELKGNPSVYIDKNMINTVIRNLLSNALKFTNTKGKIWIKTIIKNNEIKVVVQDTGVGISDDMLSTLFEPGVIKKDVNGMASSGLGLILCKEFLHQHKQELRVDSKIDYGTAFWFYLPLADDNTDG